MRCFNCRWSIGSERGLFCTRFSRAATSLCEAFEYEPGTDNEHE